MYDKDDKDIPEVGFTETEADAVNDPFGLFPDGLADDTISQQSKRRRLNNTSAANQSIHDLFSLSHILVELFLFS
jgi:hypothetical protein